MCVRVCVCCLSALARRRQCSKSPKRINIMLSTAATKAISGPRCVPDDMVAIDLVVVVLQQQEKKEEEEGEEIEELQEQDDFR